MVGHDTVAVWSRPIVTIGHVTKGQGHVTKTKNPLYLFAFN